MTQQQRHRTSSRPVVQRRPGSGTRSRRRHRHRPHRTPIPATRLAPPLEAILRERLREDRGRRGGRPDRGRRRLQPASGRLDRRRRRPLRRRVPSPVASPSRRPSANAVFPAWFTPQRRQRPASCRRAARRPSPSCPASRSRSRRVGSTAATRPISTGCSRTRPPMLPKMLASGSLAHRDLHGAASRARSSSATRGRAQSGPTAAEMVAAAAGQRSPCDRPTPVDVTIGSLTGKQFDVRARSRLDGDALLRADPPTLDLGDQRTRVFLLDSPGAASIVIFVGSLHSAGHEAFLAEAMPIVESFQFEVTP